MEDTKELLKAWCSLRAVSGAEGEAAAIAAKWISPYCEDVRITPNHSVVGMVRAPRPGEKLLMLDAHLDEIGVIVTYVDDHGFVRIAPCGGVDRRGYTAKSLIFDGEHGTVRGVVCSLPPHLSSQEKDSIPPVDQMWVDIGYTTKVAALEHISLGDRGVPQAAFLKLAGGRVSGRALDNRAGCVSLVLAAKQLAQKKEQLNIGVAVCFTCQEETMAVGAMTQAFSLTPDFAVAVDVSFADEPGTSEEISAKLGAGPMLAIAPTMSSKWTQMLRLAAQEQKIPLQLEVSGKSTGTNGDYIAVTGCGVATAVVSIPQKHMHSIGEVVDPADVEAVGKLLAAACLSAHQMR